MAKQGLHLNIYKVPGKGNLWRCDIKLNTSNHGQGITVRGTSEEEPGAMMGSWWDTVKKKLSGAGRALAKARIIAKAIISNPATQAAFPQYVGPALRTLEAFENAEKADLLGELRKQFSDETLKRLARELHEMATGQRQSMSGGGICLCDGREPRVRHVIEGMPRSFNFLGAGRGTFPSANLGPAPQWGLTMPHGGWRGRPFGMPPGNPHPFAESIREQIAKGAKDPIELQKLARMHDYQRRMARASR